MKHLLQIITCLVLFATAVLADVAKTETVHFAQGTTGAKLTGTIKGQATMHYLVGAAAGQTMTVTLGTNSKSAYFNVFEPGKVPGQDAALFIGDTGGNHFAGTLSESGDYLVQVYLYRNAARRNESASFSLDIGVAAPGSAQGMEQQDSLVAGSDFNATGNIPCARTNGQPAASCEFGVVRAGDGNGSVTVFWPDGGSRVIYFEDGTPVRYDESGADAGAAMTVEQNADLFIIKIGGQRFEIPDAVISGG